VYKILYYFRQNSRVCHRGVLTQVGIPKAGLYNAAERLATDYDKRESR